MLSNFTTRLFYIHFSVESLLTVNTRFVLLFKNIPELTILLISCLCEINELFIILAKEQGHLLLNFATADIV